MVKSIIIGSNHKNTAEYYKKINLEKSTLITSTDQIFFVGHTAIHDIPNLQDLEIVLKQCDDVYWAECSITEFFDNDSYYNFLEWLRTYNLTYKNVKNFNKIKFDPFRWNIYLPTTTIQDMIFFGSSTTTGAGISNPGDQYVNLVSKYFNKNPVNLPQLTDTVGNNDKSFDWFFQFNFVPQQLVVLHLAPLWRIRYCTENKQLVDMLLAQSPLSPHITKNIIEVYTKEFLLYNLYTKTRAIIKYARLQKLKFVFLLDDYKRGSITEEDQRYFYEFPEYLPSAELKNDMFLDFGTDNMHPGIKSNAAIADHIINHIEKLYK